jgi:hypothetical protein
MLVAEGAGDWLLKKNATQQPGHWCRSQLGSHGIIHDGAGDVKLRLDSGEHPRPANDWRRGARLRFDSSVGISGVHDRVHVGCTKPDKEE